MRPRSWTENDLKIAAKNSTSIRQILKKLKLKEAGGNYTQISKYLKLFGINTGHITGKGWNKGMKGIGKPRLPLEKVLVKNCEYQSHKLKKRLFSAKLKEEKCEICNWSQRSVDGRIPLELDHINGIHDDNTLENLRILCPNCHSMQPTHRGRNRGKK